MRCRNGVSKAEVLTFLVILGAATMVAVYYNQKPKVETKVVVVQPPPPPVEEAPPPPPAPPLPPPAPEVKAPVRETAPVLPPVIIAPPPPVPACQIIEAKLHDAQNAETQAEADLAAAKQSAVSQLQSSPDYVAAKSDAAEKKSTASAAVQKLRDDQQAGTETDEEKAGVRTAETAWLAAESKLLQMQNDSVAADPQVLEKQKALKDVSNTIATLQDSLRDYIATDVGKARQPDDCALKAVAIDPQGDTVSIDLNQPALNSAGAGMDVAISTMAHILDESLRNSAYRWGMAVFTVYFPYRGNNAVEFQATYSRSDVSTVNFVAVVDPWGHPDEDRVVNLAREFWISPLIATGQAASVAPGVPLDTGAAVNDQYGAPPVAMEYVGGVWYDVIIVGGYRRPDGSFCPARHIRRVHNGAVASADPRKVNLPPRPPASVTRGPGGV